MRNRVAILPLISCAVTTTVAAKRQPQLRASIAANHPAYTENGPQVVLAFTVTNIGAQPVDPHLTASRILVNGREITDVAVGTESGFGFGPGPHSAMLKPGQSTGFGSTLTSLRRHFAKPGVYKVRWTSTLFKSPQVTVLVAPDHPSAGEPVATTLLRRIRAQLPAGWEAFYADEYQAIDVTRLQPTPIEPIHLPNENPFTEREKPDADIMRQFELDLRLQPFVAPSDFVREKAENAQTQQQMAALYMQMRHIPHKFDSFLPGTPEEKEQVTQYERLRSTLHQLPTYYFRDISLTWGWMSGLNGPAGGESDYFRVHDKAVRKECAQVTARIKSLLTRYELAPPVPPEEPDDM